MISLIPAQFRVAALIVALVALAGASAAGGAMVASWRAEAACATATQDLRDQVGRLTDEKHALELAIAEQNKGVAIAAAQTQAAEEARRQAEQHAADLAQFSASRLGKLEETFAQATSCDAVLKAYWELRK